MQKPHNTHSKQIRPATASALVDALNVQEHYVLVILKHPMLCDFRLTLLHMPVAFFVCCACCYLLRC